jgi:uncharacterized membrane protein YhaH (DUF805 family)
MGCGCIATILALLTPRVAMVLIFLLTDWFQRAYQTTVWPLLGFLLMPYLTLAYMAMKLHGGTMTGWWLALVVAAAVVDVGHWGGSSQVHSRRR